MEALVVDLEHALVELLGATSYRLFLRDEDGRLRCARARGVEETLLDGGSDQQRAVEVHRALQKVSGALEAAEARASAERTGKRLADFCARVAWPGCSRWLLGGRPGRREFGWLLLGEKRGAEGYSAAELAAARMMLNALVDSAEDRWRNRQWKLVGFSSPGWAHDLQSLMTPVSTFFQLALEEGAGGKSAELLHLARRNLQIIQTCIRESMRVAGGAELVRLRKRPVAEPVSRAVEGVRADAERKGIRLTTHLSDRAEARIDDLLVFRLAFNLLSNAVAASPDGGEVVVSVSLSEETEGEKTRGSCVRLKVRDQGGGIPTGALLEEASQYAVDGPNPSVSSSGLGLAICRAIVELHQGRIRFGGGEPAGTGIEVDFPSMESDEGE